MIDVLDTSSWLAIAFFMTSPIAFISTVDEQSFTFKDEVRVPVITMFSVDGLGVVTGTGVGVGVGVVVLVPIVSVVAPVVVVVGVGVGAVVLVPIVSVVAPVVVVVGVGATEQLPPQHAGSVSVAMR